MAPNGTLPITRSKEFSGTRVEANDSLRICASGYSAAAIRAVTGSSSTPVTSAPSGAKAMKLPDPQPGLQHPAAGKAELTHARPHRADQVGIGVVGIEGVARRGGKFLGGQKTCEFLACPGELLACGVEHLRDCAPPGPAGQHRLFGGGRGAAVAGDVPQRGERRQIGADAGDSAGRGKVVLAVRPETLPA
jgi:hypothetical protein